MPKKNTSTKRQGFGILLGSLRDSLKMGQHEFAETLTVSRSLIANTETGTPPTATLIAQLIEKFSDQAAEIIAVAQRYNSRPSSGISIYMRSAQRRISSLLASNELVEARDLLVFERDTHYDDTGFVIWASEQLSTIEGLRNEPEASRAALLSAVRAADLNPGFETQLGPVWEKLAISYHQENIHDHANSCLDMALEITPQAASVWYRKGLIQWDDGDLSGAYASLTVALGLKGLRPDALYIRAQISSELGLADVAVADSTEVLANYRVAPVKESCMRCARAYALFLRQESRYISVPKATNSDAIVAGISSDLEAETDVMPDSPWPYYFCALCNKRNCDIIFRFVGWARQLGKPQLKDSLPDLFELCKDIQSDLENALERNNGQLSKHQVQVAKDIINTYTQVPVGEI